MFARYRTELEIYGAEALARRTTVIGTSGADELVYIPFEHVNPAGQLVLVGITPGPTQLELAYAEAQKQLRAGAADADVLMAAKRVGAFGGPSMRPNLVRMLRHFRIADILGIDDENDLWGSASGLFHATSVVPHAAFRNGKMFAGSFSDVQGSPLFRTSFLEDFVPSLQRMGADARYIALGPTPHAALAWCAEQGFITKEQ